MAEIPANRAVDARRVPAALAVGILTAALDTLYSWRQWSRFAVPSWDLGIFTQVVGAYAEWRAPIAPIKGEGYLILGDHFHPLLAALAPLYALVPSGFTLLVAQDVLFGASAAVVTACAVRQLGLASGTAIGLAYGLSWGLQSAVASQFHEVALALPLLAASLAALVDRRHRAAALWSLPLLLVKEDLGLTVAAIGVVIAIRGGRGLGAILAATGIAAFALTTQVVLPSLSPDGVWSYAHDSVLSSALTDPAAAEQRLFAGAGAKAWLLLLVFGVTGFVALGSPVALIAVPTLAWRLTANHPFFWSTYFHYSAALMPIVFMATIDALASWPLGRTAMRATAAVALLLALGSLFRFPLGELARADFHREGAHAAGARAALAAIPDGAKVVSDISLMAYLAPRTAVYWLGNPSNPVPDYVVVNRNSGVFRGHPPDDVAAFAQVQFPGESFVAVVDLDGYAVARRSTPPGPGR
jgi:uncharacterized membrane protein